MDIQDLILVGRLGEVVSFKTKDGKVLEVELTTPTTDEVKKMGAIENVTSVDFVLNFIVRVGEKHYGPENREEVRQKLGESQGALVGFLNQQCLKLVEKQEKFIEELTKK